MFRRFWLPTIYAIDGQHTRFSKKNEIESNIIYITPPPPYNSYSEYQSFIYFFLKLKNVYSMEIRLYSRIRIYIFRAYAGQHRFYSSFSSHAFIITSYTQSDLLIILPNVLCNNNYNFSILFFFGWIIHFLSVIYYIYTVYFQLINWE